VRFVVHAPPVSPSAGVRALYLLANELRRRGHTVGIAELYAPAVPHQIDSVHIYPEIVSGNPSGAQKVVRWLLYWPQLHLADWRGPDDLLVTWSDHLWPGAPRLMLDLIDTDVFYPKTKPGNGDTLLWVYKGERDLSGLSNTTAWHELRMEEARPLAALADVLREASLLYSCDPQSSLNVEAAICGTPVLFSPTAAAATRPSIIYPGWAYGPDDLARAHLEVGYAAEHYEGVRRDIAGDVGRFVELCEARWGSG